MKVQERNNTRRVVIGPGEMYVTRNNETISTLLGSCVSACLYDPVNRVIGMNHFLLASKRYAQHTPVLESEAGRYGIHAMEMLTNEMLKQGAMRHLIKAKVFGGADVLHRHRQGRDKFFVVGDINSRFVVEYLQREEIPLQATDLGGRYGRVIFFRAADQAVFVRQIDHAEQIDDKEFRFWKHSIKHQEEDAGRIEYW